MGDAKRQDYRITGWTGLFLGGADGTKLLTDCRMDRIKEQKDPVNPVH
jgi:hypothetical protein